MGLKRTLKKIGKAIERPFRTGRHEAKRAVNAANTYAAEAEAKTAALEEKTKKERRRAQKLSLRGMRSKRAASHFSTNDGSFQSYGSPTIG